MLTFLFCHVLQVHNAANSNQKEKYEADLKKEIKKLQVCALLKILALWCDILRGQLGHNWASVLLTSKNSYLAFPRTSSVVHWTSGRKYLERSLAKLSGSFGSIAFPYKRGPSAKGPQKSTSFCTGNHPEVPASEMSNYPARKSRARAWGTASLHWLNRRSRGNECVVAVP